MLDAARPRPPAPPPLPPGALHRLYAWLDALPPSRRKRHLARDFSDGGKSSTSWVSVSQEEIRKVIVNTPGAIEPILCAVRDKVEASRTRPAWLDTWVPSRGHGLCCVGTRARCLPMRVKPGTGEPWQHLDPGLPQRLLEEKERVLAVLRETVKVLQMKVARLEHPVKLKDQRVRALTRQGDQPQGGGTRGQKGPLPCPPDSDLEPTWKSPRLGVSGCGNALSIRRGATEEDPSQRVHKQKPGPS
ncbi:sperm flagellar protein 1-like isoform X5 [Bos indicus]|uniref:Sperm flagellar protein 1-like isoform X5 n=1 Tax=Bos indicus TaxID=9915 RepID=A0ABM4RNZ5_BOSIN|nr:uncharacterized protein LOC113884473 isoform X4 [Bos indicus x Bos taurus]